MLKHKRLVSIIATIAFCLSFLAPALLAPAPAVAASTYTRLTAPTVSIETGPYTGALGKVAIDIPELAALSTGDMFTISVPDGVIINKITVDHNVILNPSRMQPEIGVAFTYDAQPGAKTVDVKFNGANVGYGPARIVVSFDSVTITGISGDIKATFNVPGGVNGFAPGGEALIGKVASVKTVYATIGSVKNMSSSGGVIDGITLSEAVPGTFATGDKITLTLPNGYSWKTIPAAAGGWGLSGQTSLGDDAPITVQRVSGDLRKLEVILNKGFTPTKAGGQGGRITVGFTHPVLGTHYAAIGIDDTVASPGDIVLDISSNNLDIMPGTLTIGTYGEFKVEFLEDNPKEVVAGKREVEVGNIIIKELAPNSLVLNRDLRIDLPSGVKFARTDADATIQVARTPVKGDTLVWEQSDVGTDKQAIKLKITDASDNNAATYKISKIKVDISPAFSGDIIAKISGNQGFTGEVKLATVKPRVSIKTDGEPTKVNIGAQAQALPDILITENVKEGIRSLDVNGGRAWVTVLLPPAVVFSSLPTVEVTEGNLVIDKAGITKASNYDGIYRGALYIPVTGTSNTPSTIKLSNVKVTVDRTVAEGPLTVALVGAKEHDPFDENIYTAGDKKGQYFFNYEAVAATTGAQCVTPSASEGRSAVFYIGSTIYNVNGVNKIMDVAPYIKAGRTYVPVRYLGEALGADVAWDEVTKTVTLTKGDKSVVLEIGSTIAKVNGADVQMDVAPEIVNGRTMLPARWVAQGLGYMVGWNEVLKQVVVQEQL